MLPRVLIEDEQRHEIGVTVKLTGLPPVALRLVVFAANDGEAILIAHAQIEALVGRNSELSRIDFAAPARSETSHRG